MPLSLDIQFNIILYAIFSGILIGIIFDFYRIIRGINIPNFIIILEDVLFFVLCGVSVFAFLLFSGYAYFGIYVYIFIMISEVIYFKYISDKVYRIEKKIIFYILEGIRVVIKNISYPFRLFIAKISSKK